MYIIFITYIHIIYIYNIYTLYIYNIYYINLIDVYNVLLFLWDLDKKQSVFPTSYNHQNDNLGFQTLSPYNIQSFFIQVAHTLLPASPCSSVPFMQASPTKNLPHLLRAFTDIQELKQVTWWKT